MQLNIQITNRVKDSFLGTSINYHFLKGTYLWRKPDRNYFVRFSDDNALSVKAYTGNSEFLFPCRQAGQTDQSIIIRNTIKTEC